MQIWAFLDQLLNLSQRVTTFSPLQDKIFLHLEFDEDG